ncbi:MAG: phosphohydrolase [Deltaproteobacteria bacterium]|nr:phosphohydrolase [Deltaproteobacteria bacterium]
MSPVPVALDETFPIPSDGQCQAWWDEYEMLDNVRVHSLAVARVASALAEMASPGTENDYLRRAVRASALLHDLAKSYTIRHGGHHNQLGGAWVMNLTGNPLVAQGVIHHVFWPGRIDLDAFFLPLVIIYSDKRVRHDQVVSLQERKEDLLIRYGINERSKSHIAKSFDQTTHIERELEQRTGVSLHAHTFDRRGMVRGA